jgi:hypothetical protein
MVVGSSWVVQLASTVISVFDLPVGERLGLSAICILFMSSPCCVHGVLGVLPLIAKIFVAPLCLPRALTILSHLMLKVFFGS